MSLFFAKAGEPVTDEQGNIICFVKNSLKRHMPVSVDDFEKFTENNRPWRPGEVMDSRCIRPTPGGRGPQICINGEWRPKPSSDANV